MKNAKLNQKETAPATTLLSMADCECRWQEPRGRLDLRDTVILYFEFENSFDITKLRILIQNTLIKMNSSNEHILEQLIGQLINSSHKNEYKIYSIIVILILYVLKLIIEIIKNARRTQYTSTV
jgi:hypothetical protein